MAGQCSSNCAGKDLLRRRHSLIAESCFRPRPQERRDECAAALLTEIARDHFPQRHPQGRGYMPSACDLLEDAACAVADFAAALMAGSHGPGCPGRSEEEAADETCNRGNEPYSTLCGTGIHILRGMTGWHHVHGSTAADDQTPLVEILDPGHEPALGWRIPARPTERL